jgi:cytoskeleton protein RodZ
MAGESDSTRTTAEPIPTPREQLLTPMAVDSGVRELAIKAIDEAWLSLALDGQPAKQFLLRAGESRSWSARHFSLTVGNAGGIMLSLDGHELQAIGRPGQVVRNLRIPDDGPSSPSPSPT